MSTDKKVRRINLPQFENSSSHESQDYDVVASSANACGTNNFVPGQCAENSQPIPSLHDALPLSEVASSHSSGHNPEASPPIPQLRDDVGTDSTLIPFLNRFAKETIAPTPHPDLTASSAMSVDFQAERERDSASPPSVPPPSVSHVPIPDISVTPDPASSIAVSHRGPSSGRRIRKKRPNGLSYLWSFAGIIGVALFSVMGLVAFRWLTWLPPDPDCQNLPLLPPDSDRLYCAQQASQDGDVDSIIAGINLIQGWQSGHPLYRKAQTAMTEWSALLLIQAEAALLHENGLESALEITAHIPPGSPLYEEAQGRMLQWKSQWEKGESIYQQALIAIENQDWHQATDQVSALRTLAQPYWRDNRSHDLSLQVSQEKNARQQLDEATALAASGNLNQLVEALSIVNKIHPQTLAWAEAQPRRQQWAQALIQQGIAAMASGNLERAVELVEDVPIDLAVDGEARNLVLYSYAQRITTFDSVPWQVNPFETWQLTEAIAAAQQISADSQFYGVAQGAIAQWQLELNNLEHLQLAQWLAHVGNRPALNLAMHQAALVEPDDPRRLQAQTLIAHWNQQIQQILDRPQLILAQRMAEPGTMEALNAAIAHTSTFRAERLSWPQADHWITQWTQKIQALEDRPILIEAREMASDGQWKEAIDRAGAINSERSLYPVAQNNIKEWQAELQLELDTENLAQARDLASRVRLTAAINHATQIQPGQPLYTEAQSLIGQWSAQRESIWARQNAQAETSRANSSTEGPSSDSGQNSYEGYYDSRYYDYHRH